MFFNLLISCRFEVSIYPEFGKRKKERKTKRGTKCEKRVRLKHTKVFTIDTTHDLEKETKDLG